MPQTYIVSDGEKSFIALTKVYFIKLFLFFFTDEETSSMPNYLSLTSFSRFVFFINILGQAILILYIKLNLGVCVCVCVCVSGIEIHTVGPILTKFGMGA
jgi:hypothetical protein